MEAKVIKTEEDIHHCETLLQSCKVIALDCEGVDLGRTGELTIVQVSSRSHFFLFDVLNLHKDSPSVIFLKALLENPSILKVVHDVKMDSDALYHGLGIALANVHDTQGWDYIVHGREDNLNRTLVRNNCTPNVERDKDVYRVDNRFWAKRPLTKLMIEWASGDVGCLFELYDKQINQVTNRNVSLRCADESNERLRLREKVHRVQQIKRGKIGLFIGSGGQNIKDLQRAVPGTFYQINRGSSHFGTFCDVCIYADDEKALTRAIQQVKRYS